jgi:deoxyribonuclease V
MDEQRVVEQHIASRLVRFPYVPGLLSFREAPALLAALRRLHREPDVLLCDGQGRAHPRRFGIACHLGVLCDLPAIGCAKSLLVGTHASLSLDRGASQPLVHHNEIVGTVLRTQEGIRPVYVSIGHRMDLPKAVDLVLAAAIRYRLPEPTRLADRWIAQFRTAPGTGCRSGKTAGCR